MQLMLVLKEKHCCTIGSVGFLHYLDTLALKMQCSNYFCLLQKTFRPVKYFSIDRVFRNENLDATHLAEFHQIEGVVADRGLTLGHLMGIIQEFFHKLGQWSVRYAC